MNKILNRALLALVTVAFLAWMGAGCGDSTVSGPPSQASSKSVSTQARGPIPPVPVRGPADDVVQGFLDAWNDTYGAAALGLGYRYRGTVADDAAAQQLVDRITDPTTSFAPFGWADEPARMQVLALQDQDYDAAEYLAYVSGYVQQGLHYYELSWQTTAGQDFVSYFFATQDGAPVFGNMYSLTLFVNPQKIVPGLSHRAEAEACADFDTKVWLTVNWAWPFDDTQRGEASLTVHVECDCEGEECVTTDEDIKDKVETMNLGTAHAEAEFVTDEHGNRECLVGLSLSTATADVEIEFDAEKAKVKFKASGLGSTAKYSTNVDADCDGTCPEVEVERVETRQIESATGRF